MALFNASEILRDEQDEKQIPCDFLAIPVDAEVPVIVIGITQQTRKVYQQAVDRHNSIRIRYRKDAEPEGVIINEPVEFCCDILQAAYLRSFGLFDTDSKPAVIALMKKQPGFAKRLAGKLIEAFEGSELFTDDAKKN